MSSDPLALQKDLNGARCQPHLDLAPGKVVGDAVEMALELDMVIDADPANAPFGALVAGTALHAPYLPFAIPVGTGSVGGGPTFAEAMVNGGLRRDRSS